MSTVISRDGTAIAFDRSGTGPAVILVDGALCHRAFGPSRPLAEQLKPDFTVYTYDRRGRGESGNTVPYSVEREVEDLEALLVEAGGTAFVYGTSSGAALALEAARTLPGVTKLVVYEPPFVVAETEPLPGDYLARIEAAVTAGRRGEAVKVFMKQVGAPGFFVALLPLLPPWSKLKATAHTIPYDLTILSEGQRGRELRAEKFSSIKVPTLAAVGGKSPQAMQHAVEAVAAAMPDAQYRVLPGQTHMVKPRPLAPVLAEFFKE
jgi:pimeloyl-ACP methyl ester carboxylesterase